MSGPKVIRIVTREEIIAICEGLLRRLDQTIDSWTRDGRRIGELTDEEIAATLQRRTELGELLTKNAFNELQKRVPDEISFLSVDLARRQQLAIDKVAQVRKRQRQGRDNAASLMRELESRDVAISAELYEKLNSLALGNAVTNPDSVLGEASALLSAQSPVGLSGMQRNLADQHLVGIETQDSSTWKSAHTPTTSNARLEGIDRQMAELQTLLTAERLADFTTRIRAIESTDAAAQQNLLLDSLILDMAAAVKDARVHHAALRELTALAAELRECAAGTAGQFERIPKCNPTTPIGMIDELVDECKASIAEAHRHREAEARRKAILQGLSQLGYEVHEGMETAWAKDGQVIAKKHSLPGYGVEIGGQAHTGRLQVRAVALTPDRDVNRDKDVETIWCGEFSKLQALLAERGSELVVERSVGVGIVPLKTISAEELDLGNQAKGRTIG